MRFADGLKVLVLAGVFAVTGCDSGGGSSDGSGGGSGGADRAATILGLTGDAAAGETVFMDNLCSSAACHGPDGTSGTAPALTEQVPAASDEQIVNSLLNGKGDMTPQSALSDQELADVLAYVNANFG
jgi:mono/diheme cytochrome c family protein